MDLRMALPRSVVTSWYASYLTTKPETFSMNARMGVEQYV